MEWEELWDTLLNKQKLRQKVIEMDQVDQTKTILSLRKKFVIVSIMIIRILRKI